LYSQAEVDKLKADYTHWIETYEVKYSVDSSEVEKLAGIDENLVWSEFWGENTHYICTGKTLATEDKRGDLTLYYVSEKPWVGERSHYLDIHTSADLSCDSCDGEGEDSDGDECEDCEGDGYATIDFDGVVGA